MQITGGDVDEPGASGSNVVGGQGAGGTVQCGDGARGEIVAKKNSGRARVAILDGIERSQGQIDRIIVHVRARCRLQADPGAGLSADATIIGDEVILDLSTRMG